MLKSHISKELPDILEDITNAIKRCETEKDKLGDERDTAEKQKNYLIDVGEKFKYLMTCALEGEYSDSYFEQEIRRLRALIMNANEVYASTMIKYGHRWDLKDTAEDDHQSRPVFPPTAPKHFAYKVTNPHVIEPDKLVKQVILMQHSHRGLELPGMPQPRLVGKLFKQQSERWKRITEVHVAHIFDITKQFVEDLLNHVAGGKTSAGLLSEVVDPVFESREKALQRKLEEVLKPYTNERPLTLNTKYITNMNRNSTGKGLLPTGVLADHTDGEIQSCQRIIESMQAYYDIALNVLLDNVALLVIEHCLLDDLNQTISPRSMQRQSDTQVERLAGESHDVTARRQVLSRMLEEYRRGQRLIKAHSQRPYRSANIEASQPGMIGSVPDNEFGAAVTNKLDSGTFGSQKPMQVAGNTSPVATKTEPTKTAPSFVFGVTDFRSLSPRPSSMLRAQSGTDLPNQEHGPFPPRKDLSVKDASPSSSLFGQTGFTSTFPAPAARGFGTSW